MFGVECSIKARDLAWEWIGDAHERFSVGDQVLVRILNVRRDSLNDVCFAVNRIDEERGVTVGIITRIIRQNL